MALANLGSVSRATSSLSFANHGVLTYALAMSADKLLLPQIRCDNPTYVPNAQRRKVYCTYVGLIGAVACFASPALYDSSGVKN